MSVQPTKSASDRILGRSSRVCCTRLRNSSWILGCGTDFKCAAAPWSRSSSRVFRRREWRYSSWASALRLHIQEVHWSPAAALLLCEKVSFTSSCLITCSGLAHANGKTMCTYLTLHCIPLAVHTDLRQAMCQVLCMGSPSLKYLTLIGSLHKQNSTSLASSCSQAFPFLL